jgi:hypothetical protein
MTWTTYSDFFGQGFGQAFGDPLVSAILMVFFFIALNYMLGLEFDAILVNFAPVIWVFALPISLGGAGVFPEWMLYIALMVAALIGLLGFLRLFNR